LLLSKRCEDQQAQNYHTRQERRDEVRAVRHHGVTSELTVALPGPRGAGYYEAETGRKKAA
jgi:hypothetical protein